MFVADRLLNEGSISMDESGYIGWKADPYIPDFNEGLPMNQSEKSEYDQDFPDHPLSVSRKLLDQIESEIET